MKNSFSSLLENLKMKEQLRKSVKERGENTCLSQAKQITNLELLKWYDAGTRIMNQINAYMRIRCYKDEISNQLEERHTKINTRWLKI